MNVPKLIIFDLDGTLAESKQPITSDMGRALAELLKHTRVAVISGGALPHLLTHVVDRLPADADVSRLYLLPTTGAALYEFEHDSWKKVFEEPLTHTQARRIEEALRAAADESGVIDWSDTSWGERIENRGSQVTLSALGQQAPIALKKAWDPDHAKRHKLQAAIVHRLPGFSVGIGGATSIDVSKEGIDKAYGVRKLCERLGLKESEALYVGDELEQGGNDEPIYKTEVPTRAVASPSETAALIRELLLA